MLPDMAEALRDYRRLVESVTPLQRGDWQLRLEQMASADPFPFFRATFFRWLALFAGQPDDIRHAPRVLGVGDLHAENFGTWRDELGRLCWGINDFDEAAEYPYTLDLVRLAASVRLAARRGHLDIGFGRACDLILKGYREALEEGGPAFILEEDHAVLRRLATRKQDEPAAFWEKFVAALKLPDPPDIPEVAMRVLSSGLPVGATGVKFRARSGVGLGSLGKPRYVCLAKQHGAWLAREAKLVTPSAAAWQADPHAAAAPTAAAAAELLAHAVRCRDPLHAIEEGWVIRRIGPRCKRIGLATLAEIDEVSVLLESFGRETANVHLARPERVVAVLEDLKRQPKGWLADSARAMLKLTLKDWKAWRGHVANAK